MPTDDNTPSPADPTPAYPGPSPEPVRKRFRLRAIRRTIEIVLLIVFVVAFAAAARGAWANVTARDVLPALWAVLAALALNAAWLRGYRSSFSLTIDRAIGRTSDRTIDQSGGAHERIDPRSVAELFYRSHLARYVPGKVVQLGVLTDGLVRRGLPLGLAARVVGAHQLGYAAATGIVGIPVGGLLVLAGAPTQGLAVLALGAVSLAAAVFWLVPLGSLGVLIPARAGKLVALGATIAHASAPDRLGDRATRLLAYAAVAAGQGVVVLPLVWALAPPRTPLGPVALLAACGSYPVARLVGQLGVIVPGGLGLREGAFALLTLPLLGGPAAAAVAVWARLISMAAETGVYLLAAWGARRARRASRVRCARTVETEPPTLTPP